MATNPPDSTDPSLPQPAVLISAFSGHNVNAGTKPEPELLKTLGHLARGLSLLFWGLPLALVICVQTAKGDWFRPLGVIPPVVVTGLLFHALRLLGRFQKQERIWHSALDRLKFLALINCGISPFLYWWNRIPSNLFFSVVVEVLMLSGLLFLILLNPVLVRLTAMLPDETLRTETRYFTMLNRYILFTLLFFLGCFFAMIHIDAGLPNHLLGLIRDLPQLQPETGKFIELLNRSGIWLVLLLLLTLLPVAVTMALLWKIKDAILTSVFGSLH